MMPTYKHALGGHFALRKVAIVENRVFVRLVQEELAGRMSLSRSASQTGH
jgi:hypothetical protein